MITGGARGQGAAHARRFVQEGAKVILTDVIVEEGQALAKELGENARFVKQDVSSADDWKKVVAEAESTFGLINVLVNNAAITFSVPIEELTEEQIKRIIGINQISVLLGMKAVLPSMKKANGGSIVNVSSIGGFVGTPGSCAYDGTKFAVRGMTKGAAQEFAKYGIRVNSVHPGMIATPMLLDVIPEEIQAELFKNIPLGRFAQPEEVTNLVLYLASDEASYSTGSEFIVDGGYLA
ncbi:MAG: glucose 1-dehydrogenase [Eubacteriales bacterium]|nr:glucose 1-dehydrogenase [Eubacteriales bacterium]